MNVCEGSCWKNENDLKLLTVMIVQPVALLRNHWLVHLKRMNYMVGKI